MKKMSKNIIALFIAVLMLATTAIPSFAMSDIAWDLVWEGGDTKAAITMFVGSNESERNFSWYSDTQSEPYVKIAKNLLMLDASTFTGTSVAAPDGDYSNKVVVTGLEEDTTYYYQCVSGDFTSAVYSFTTDSGADFSALYVTDVHVSYSDEDENSLRDTALKFNNTIEDAMSNNSDISLILSAGDQASEGYESEYKAYCATPWLNSVSLATAIGNHDRKGVAYKTFTNYSNEDKDALITSYIGDDYWFVKGDVLFLVIDSNNANAEDHALFIEEAIAANPDVRWKIMMFHHDLFSGRIPHRESENGLLRMIWGPIADEFGIDLVLLGHSHYYTVTNVLNNYTKVADLAPVMSDLAGTVYMVSCSVNRPRNDDEVGLNDWVGFDYLTENATYNIIDFTQDSVTVNSYELGENVPFNSFTITKSTDNGGHEQIGELQAMWNGFVRKLSKIYALFNNIGVYSDLKEDGYDVNFFECILGK